MEEHQVDVAETGKLERGVDLGGSTLIGQLPGRDFGGEEYLRARDGALLDCCSGRLFVPVDGCGIDLRVLEAARDLRRETCMSVASLESFRHYFFADVGWPAFYFSIERKIGGNFFIIRLVDPITKHRNLITRIHTQG
jgi:hypothetical protein